MATTCPEASVASMAPTTVGVRPSVLVPLTNDPDTDPCVVVLSLTLPMVACCVGTTELVSSTKADPLLTTRPVAGSVDVVSCTIARRLCAPLGKSIVGVKVQVLPVTTATPILFDPS